MEANAAPGDDVIAIAVSGTINLGGPLPDLSTNIEIVGPAASLLTVRRDTEGAYRIFTVATGATVALSDLTISNGFGTDGGGIYTLGNQPGTTLRGNHIHRVERSRFAGRAENNGIFFDEGTRNLLVERNAIYDIANSLIRFNRSDKSWQTFRDNAFGVSPGAEGFPADVAEAAGPTQPPWRTAPPTADPVLISLFASFVWLVPQLHGAPIATQRLPE